MSNKNLSIETVRQSASRSVEGIPVLGFLVYWGLSNVEISKADFQARLTEVGFDPSVARDLRVRSRLSKAIDMETRHGRGAKKKHAVLDNSERMAYAIVTSHASDNDVTDVAFTTETKVILDKATGTIAGSGADIARVKERFENIKDKYLTGDFLAAVLRLVKNECCALTIRDRGGVYFVPATKESELDKLKELFSTFPDCYIEAIPVPDCTSAKRSTWRTFLAEATEALAKMNEEIEAIDEDTRESTIERRFKKIEELRFKVEQYEFLLSGTAVELNEKLSEATASLRRKLNGD